MGNGVFGIAVSGLRAAQIGLTTTSQNISNASTPGYNRQTITQSATDPLGTGSGFLGRGVQVDTITRVYNEFVSRQVQTAQAQDGYLTNLQSHLADLDNLLADPSAGFSPSLQDFFTGIQTVANNPSNAAARQSLLGLAESMITKLKTVNDRMSTLRTDVNTEVTAAVGSINALTSQVANLNEQISLAAGSANGNPPNDLLDKRDQLIKELNKLVKSTVVKQGDGSYNVFIGNGQNLVVGNQAFTLGAVASAEDPSRLDVAYQQYGSTVVIPSELITGGSLGGVLDFRKNVLDTTQNSLGRVAVGLAQTVNDQHRKGQDLNGQLGGNFFQFPFERVNVQPKVGANQVTLTAQINAEQPFVESDFSIALDGAGTNYTITRNTDGQQVTIPLASGQLTSGSGVDAFGIRFKLSINPNVVAGTGPDLKPGESTGISFLPAAAAIIPNSHNTGNAALQVSIADVNKLSVSDYELTYDGPDYRLQRKSDGMVTNISASQWANQPVTVDGLQLRFNSGSMKTGDRFTIQPTRGFPENMSVQIKDTAKVAAAAPIRSSADTFSIATTKNPANTGGANIAAVSASVSAQGGSAAKSIEILFKGTVGVAATSYDIRDSATGAVLVANQPYPNPSTATGATVSYNGWTAQISEGSGPPVTGDRFLVEPRKNKGTATISNGAITTVPVDAASKVPVAIRFQTSTTFQFVNPTNGRIYDTASKNVFDPATGNLLDSQGAILSSGLSIDAATGNVVDSASGVVIAAKAYTSGADIKFNGWKTQVSGVPASGDTFLVQPNSGGTSDGRNMLAIGQLQTANTLNGGTASYQGAYSKLVADVGVKSNQTNINQAAQAQILQQAEKKMSEGSGVNLDEEAANLLVFQQAYQASSKVIQVAQKVFEEIMSIGA